MKFWIYTLGCKVNTYESSVIHDKFINKGYTQDNNNADIYVINTCTVTNTSDSKSLKAVRHCKKTNPDSIIVVCGCMSQVNTKIDELKDADIIIGNRYKSDIVELVEQFIKTKERIIKIDNIQECPFEEMMLNNFERTRAFVKIEDGCENYCTYCIIPYARGKVRSKEPNKVIEEINSLISNGHKEIVLTGIHTGHYGADLEDYTFAKLLKEIVKIEGLERLRISSIEITELNEEVLDVFRESKILVDHIHIPLQSGSNEILKLMNRKYDKQYFIDKINEIRSIRPLISITTDIIVGFPGETEELFNETLETVNKIKFSKIHVFPFSLREGTKACELPNHLDNLTKKERVKVLMDISKKLEIEYMNRFLNSSFIFIPEVYKDDVLIGHTGNYLLIKCMGDINSLHENIKVKIEKIEYPYCIGKLDR